LYSWINQAFVVSMPEYNLNMIKINSKRYLSESSPRTPLNEGGIKGGSALIWAGIKGGSPLIEGGN
jgi:hypothetical protein